MNMIKPKPLRRGDTIGLVGISGALHEPETRFEKMLEAIDALGYKVIVADSCREEYGYLSGTDASRAKGLNQMFRDDRVDAVVCMRGGYGVTRILDRVDFDVIRANPKLLLGYSDITALHTAIHEKVGMVTIHGPMPDRAWMEFDDFSRRSMLRALTSTEPLGTLYNPEGTAPKCVVPGRCAGRLVGGNLSLIAALCGTPYQLNPEGKVLLLED
ncbi:MAG: LD-carboxypeptidase, partial [Clostridia bacterium]|nr:LD-carboxypeptidase [Clostridia bacterium]